MGGNSASRYNYCNVLFCVKEKQLTTARRCCNEATDGRLSAVVDGCAVGMVCGSSSVDLRCVIGNGSLTDSCPASITGALPVCLAGMADLLLTGDICQAIQLLFALSSMLSYQKCHSVNQQFALGYSKTNLRRSFWLRMITYAF